MSLFLPCNQKTYFKSYCTANMTRLSLLMIIEIEYTYHHLNKHLNT